MICSSNIEELNCIKCFRSFRLFFLLPGFNLGDEKINVCFTLFKKNIWVTFSISIIWLSLYSMEHEWLFLKCLIWLLSEVGHRLFEVRVPSYGLCILWCWHDVVGSSKLRFLCVPALVYYGQVSWCTHLLCPLIETWSSFASLLCVHFFDARLFFCVHLLKFLIIENPVCFLLWIWFQSGWTAERIGGILRPRWLHPLWLHCQTRLRCNWNGSAKACRQCCALTVTLLICLLYCA